MIILVGFLILNLKFRNCFRYSNRPVKRAGDSQSLKTPDSNWALKARGPSQDDGTVNWKLPLKQN